MSGEPHGRCEGWRGGWQVAAGCSWSRSQCMISSERWDMVSNGALEESISLRVGAMGRSKSENTMETETLVHSSNRLHATGASPRRGQASQEMERYARRIHLSMWISKLRLQSFAKFKSSPIIPATKTVQTLKSPGKKT